jgi:hypothetical protein
MSSPESTTVEPVRSIVTHPTPDIDALLSVYLLRRHGGALFPGCADCEVRFMSPAAVEAAGGADAIEREGHLLVDLGGGRFDNHPTSDQAGDLDAAAAELVAEHLGVRQRPELVKLLSFCSRQDLKGESIRSRDPVDHAVALPAIVDGLNEMYPTDGVAVYRAIEPVFDALVTTEGAWGRALADAERALRADVDGVMVMAMESGSRAAARAGRYNGADLLCVRYLPQGYVAFTLKRQGPLARMTMEGLAARIRRAEADAAGQPPRGDLRAVGMHGGWFLHQSRKILNKGSPKAPDVQPSALTLADLHALAIAEIRSVRGRKRR